MRKAYQTTTKLEQPNDCIQRDANRRENKRHATDLGDSPRLNLRCNLLRAPRRYEACFVLHAEPKTYDEAVIGKDSEKWIQTIREKLAAHEQNRT